jgi:hypothetical protein
MASIALCDISFKLPIGVAIKFNIQRKLFYEN